MVINSVFGALIQAIVNLHYCSLIAAAVAVVGSRKHRHNIFVVLPLVSLHHELMRPSNKVQAIDVGELLGDILTERVTRSSRRDTPATPVIGIRPHKVAHGALMRHLLYSV